ISENSLTARGVYGFWPANSTGDDVSLYLDDKRAETLATFYFLRQQMQKPAGQANHCLADFVAPKNSQPPVAPERSGEGGSTLNSQLSDYLGGFAVSIHGADELAKKFSDAHD